MVAKKSTTTNAATTIAATPFWPGFLIQKQRFRTSYAEFMATLACLSTANPFWPFMVLFPIQFVSWGMTLVCKGFLSEQGFHYLYATLL